VGELLRWFVLLPLAGVAFAVTALFLTHLPRSTAPLPDRPRLRPTDLLLAALLFLLGARVGRDTAAAVLGPPWDSVLPGPAGLLAVMLALFLLGHRPVWFAPRPPRQPWSWTLRVAFAALPALVAAALLQDAVLSSFGIPGPPSLPTGLEASVANLAPYVLLAVVLAPCLEEAVFRGFLFQGLAAPDRLGRVRALLFSSLLFAALHPLSLFLPTFVLGAVCAWARWQGGDLRHAIGLHALYNGAVVGAAAVL